MTHSAPVYTFDDLLNALKSSRAISFRPVETLMQIHAYPGDGGYATLSLKDFRYLTPETLKALDRVDAEITPIDEHGILRITGRKDVILRQMFGQDHRLQVVPKSVFYYVDRAFGADITPTSALYFEEAAILEVPALDDTLKTIQVLPHTLVMYERGLLHVIHLESETTLRRVSIMTLTRDMARSLIAQGLNLQEALRECPHAVIEKEDTYLSGGIYNESIPCDPTGKPLASPDPFTHMCRPLHKMEHILLSVERNLKNADAIVTHLKIIRHMRALDDALAQSQVPFINARMNGGVLAS